MNFKLLPWNKSKPVEKPNDKLIELIKQGPKVSEPDSHINRAENNQVFIDELRGLVG